MPKLIVPIRGMHCSSCEILVGNNLEKLSNVTKVKVNQRKGKAEVFFNGKRPADKEIISAVKEAGYEVGEKEKLPWISTRVEDYRDLVKAALVLVALYYAAKGLGLFNLSVASGGSSGLFVALLVGLVAGVSTCMALIGGLTLSLSARHAELHPEATPMQKFRPHLYFNLGRIAGYTFLGGIIGLIGTAFKPSAGVLGILTMIIGGVMIFFGLKLVEIFPVLKDKSITLPSGIARLLGIKQEIKEYSHKSAMIMGSLTFFLPCGFTQAMQLYAVSTGSFAKGALVMGLFALGTAPGLLGIGGLTSIFKGKKARIFFMGAGMAVIMLGWFNVANGSRLVSGAAGRGVLQSAPATGDAQIVRMTQGGSGYSPNILTVQKGKPVRWIINSTNSFTCASSLVVPSLGISETLRQGENEIDFTPTEAGEISFSCSMGMYRGKFIVTDGPSASADGAVPGVQTAQAASIPSGGGSCGGGGGCGGCGGGARKNVVPQSGNTDTVGAGQIIKATYTYDKDISPNTFTVKAGQPVRFEVDVKEDGSGCMSTIMIRGLYESPQVLRAGEKIVMQFTPQTPGRYMITCAMGVPRGVINVE